MISLLLILLTFTVFQGESFNFELKSPSEVVLPNCMFFEHSMTNREFLHPGNYSIYVSYKCSKEEIIIVNRGNVSEQYYVYVKDSVDVAKIDDRIVSLKKEIVSLKNENQYMRSLIKLLNDINIDLYDKLTKCSIERLELRNRTEFLEISARNCSLMLQGAENKIKVMEEDIKILSKRLETLESSLEKALESEKRAEEQLKFFQLSFILIISVFIGLIFAFIRK